MKRRNPLRLMKRWWHQFREWHTLRSGHQRFWWFGRLAVCIEVRRDLPIKSFFRPSL